MDWMRTARGVANLVNLSTPLGLVLAGVGRGRLHHRGWLIIAEHVRLPLVTAGAMTVGEVVLVMGRSAAELEAVLPEAMTHEEEHAWQWAYCLGLPFLPLYALACGWSLLRRGDRATGNFFEVQAGLQTGGYLRDPASQLRHPADTRDSPLNCAAAGPSGPRGVAGASGGAV